MNLKTLFAFCLVGLLASSAFAVEEVYVHHILTRTKQQADKALDEIINDGGTRESFIKAARKYSLDHPSKYAGGDLGWNSRSKLVDEFSNAAFSAEPGDIVPEAVRTQYGWHVIYLKAKRDLQAAAREKANAGANPTPPSQPEVTAPTPTPTPTPAPAPTPTPTPAPAPTPTPTPTPTKEVVTPTGAKQGAPLGSRPKAPAKAPGAAVTSPDESKAAPVKPPVTASKPAVVSADVYAPTASKLDKTALGLSLSCSQRVVRSNRELIVTATVQNNGLPARIFNPSLLPLGFRVRTDGSDQDAVGTWEKVADPENFVVDLASRGVAGGSFVISDYFTSLPKNGRIWVSWEATAFTTNFGSRFPGKSQEVTGYSDAVAAVSGSGFVSSNTPKGLPKHYSTRTKELPLAVFDSVSDGGKYFARIRLRSPQGDVWFELFTEKQFTGVQHFSKLAQEGFYDGLRFFDIQAEEYLQTGCPKNDGTGGSYSIRTVKTPEELSHEKGILSLVTRLSPRANSRVAGSIFFITRKELKDYDGVHAPIGKILVGEDLLAELETRRTGSIASISIVAESRAPNAVVVAAGGTPAVVDAGTSASESASAEPAETATPAETVAEATIVRRPQLPRVRIETSKGNMVAELFQDDARNTVSNFVTLAEEGFYNADPDSGKASLQFFDKNADYYVRTGSPDNSEAGGPAYTIRSETSNNTKTHQKGTLTMCLDQNSSTGQPIPDTAGSQFLICLDVVGYWNGLYTPFGRVVEGLDVLAQIEKGDTIKSVQVIQKRDGLYKANTTPKN